MSNRRKIEKFCKANGLEVQRLHYQRGDGGVMAHGEIVCRGVWFLDFGYKNDNYKVDSDNINCSIDEDVDQMLDYIRHEILV